MIMLGPRGMALTLSVDIFTKTARRAVLGFCSFCFCYTSKPDIAREISATYQIPVRECRCVIKARVCRFVCLYHKRRQVALPNVSPRDLQERVLVCKEHVHKVNLSYYKILASCTVPTHVQSAVSWSCSNVFVLETNGTNILPVQTLEKFSQNVLLFGIRPRDSQISLESCDVFHHLIPPCSLQGLVAQLLGNPQQKAKQRWRFQVMRNASHDGVAEKDLKPTTDVYTFDPFCHFFYQ